MLMNCVLVTTAVVLNYDLYNGRESVIQLNPVNHSPLSLPVPSSRGGQEGEGSMIDRGSLN